MTVCNTVLSPRAYRIPSFTYICHRLKTLPSTLILNDFNTDWNLDGFTLRDPYPLGSLEWESGEGLSS